MRQPLSYRQEAEAIEQFGDELTSLLRGLDRLAERMSPGAIDGINAIEGGDRLYTIAAAYSALGAELSRACDANEETEDRRRANPLEPDFRGAA